MIMRTKFGVSTPAIVLAFLCGCTGGKTERAYIQATGGHPDRGKAFIEAHDCGTCHTIPGIREARGKVAPPLNFFSQRTFIAGVVPNSPQNLVQWVMNPPSIAPDTAMPILGLDEQQARDVAAYLYTLQ